MSHLPSPIHTSDEPDVPEPVLPSQRTIAFAISVVKSKPPELSIEEYIKLLRQHIAPGRQENALSSVYAHLDRSAYWRTRADLAKADLERSQDEAVGLRQEVASLKRKLDSRPSSPVKKRKKQDADVILVPRSPKRNKRATSPNSGVQGTFDHPTDDEFSQAGEFGDTLLRSIFHILAIFRTTQRTRPSELAYHVERASSAIPKIVQKEIQKLVTEDATDNEQLKDALTITTRAIATVLAGYTRLTHAHDTSEGATVQGRVIYAIVAMFRNLLCDFQLLSNEESTKVALANQTAAITRPATAQTSSARPSTAQNPPARPSTARMSSPNKSKHIGMPSARPSTALTSFPGKSKGKVIGMPKSTAQMPPPESSDVAGKAKARPLRDQKVKVNPTLSLYTTFLGNLIDMLDAKVEANRPLFEGFSYCVLDKVGKRLYSTVFGRSRASDLEAEIKQDENHNQDQSESAISALPPSDTDDNERKQIQLEAPYLLHLLNRVMIAAPAHFIKVKTNKAKNNKAPSKNTLALSAKECLQRTLVNAIFGTEGVKDDDLFKECLKMPSPAAGTLTMPKVKEADVLEHFKAEVWRCLGWEILAKDGDW